MATAVLSTLEHVTFRKLQRLAEQRSRFESQKTTIISTAAAKTSQTDKVRALLAGFKEHNVSLASVASDFHNVKHFLDQADYDPSISSDLVEGWADSLVNELDKQSLKYEYATLFGRLVTEWIKTSGAGEKGENVSLISLLCHSRSLFYDSLNEKKPTKSFELSFNLGGILHLYIDDTFLLSFECI
jgi:hypothetical protein